MFKFFPFGFLNKYNNNSESNILGALDKSQAIIEFKMDGTIISANKLFLDVMGYSLEEIQGRHHSMFALPDYAKSNEYKKFWDKLRAGEFQRAEYLRLGKNAQEVWIQASYNPIIGSNGKPFKVIKFATDITQQKLQNSYYESQIQAINKSQAVIEFETDGTIITANENFLSAMGYTLEEIKGKHHSMFADPDYASSREYKEFWNALAHGEYQTAEYLRYGKNNKEVWIQASYNPILDMRGRPFKVVKFATDITQQKIQNSYYEGQLMAISKSQAVIEFEVDGTIITANDNFLHAMGYTLNEIKGKHHSMFADPEYAKSREYKEFWEKLANGEYQTAEYLRYGKNRKEVWIQASYNPILDAKGVPFKVVKFATDVTRQMQARLEAQGKSEKTNADIQSVSNATRQMSSSVREISENVINSQDAVKDIIHKNSDASNLTTKLQKNTEAMEGIVTLIRKISEQVNLLALNATIEAARAGDAGKGFAVVAGEVKGLANETAKATDLISEEILSIQQIVNEVVSSGSVIAESTQTVGEYIQTIVTSMDEQTLVTREISTKINSIADGVHALDECVKSISKLS